MFVMRRLFVVVVPRPMNRNKVKCGTFGCRIIIQLLLEYRRKPTIFPNKVEIPANHTVLFLSSVVRLNRKTVHYTIIAATTILS